MRDKKQQIKRVHISHRKFLNYAKEHNIDPSEMYEKLSAEELKQFELGLEKFPTGQMPMWKKNNCFICNKKTGWLDKFHGLYMCSEKCRDVIDDRYNAGEDFEQHPVFIQLVEDHIKDFEE